MTESTGAKIARGVITTIEVGLIGGAAYLGIRSLIDYNNYAQIRDGLQPAGLTVPGVTSTIPPLGEIPATPQGPEAPQTADRLPGWLNFWPDTAKEAADMFGGSEGDWQKSSEWPGNRKAESTFYGKGYNPIEWKPANPENAPYYWPKTPEEAAAYFFPGQALDPKWMRQNQYGGWELMQDHWIDGYKTDMTATIYPGVVAEGYSVKGDDVAENDRNFVAWGGKNNGVNAGIALPLANGQGMTLWPPGTDPNKIGIEAKPYNIPYYTGPNGEQLGPNAINFTPIYNAPEFAIIAGVKGNGILAQINRHNSALGANVDRPSFASTIPASYKNPWRGMSQSRGNFSGNGRA
jgi:hypothetical protein